MEGLKHLYVAITIPIQWGGDWTSHKRKLFEDSKEVTRPSTFTMTMVMQHAMMQPPQVFVIR